MGIVVGHFTMDLVFRIDQLQFHKQLAAVANTDG